MGDIAEIVRAGALDMQVCVPSDWDDSKVVKFANENNFCGTTNGWVIRKQGDRLLNGCNERVDCEQRRGFVHITLDA